jgi:hypothetical protein
MEQHPVPQNVTTFQFRLIGDMTIKQFGYLAAGAILAYVTYKLPLPFLITWPGAAIFALLGFGFAFIPVEERPMDVWVLSFFKSIYAPTQYLWQKGAKTPEPAARSAQAPAAPAAAATKTGAMDGSTPIVRASPGSPTAKTPLVSQKPDTKNVVAQLFAQRADAMAHVAPRPTASPFAWFENLLGTFRKSPATATPPAAPQAASVTPFTPGAVPSVTGVHVASPVAPPQPTLAETAQAKAAQDEALLLQEKVAGELEEKIKTLSKELSTKESGETRILELQKQLTDVLAEKNKMEKELLSMRARAGRPSFPMAQPFPRTPARPSPFVSDLEPTAASAQPNPGVPPAPQGPTVRVITQDAAVKAGLPRLTSVPNVVTGITKDNQGNLLPGVLVTVRDKDDIPLRALKTNKLGQFAASTPLPSGTYLVEVEDPRNRFVFDRAQITLNGGVIAPIEIIAKSQKELTRQKLAAEIFGAKDM